MHLGLAQFDPAHQTWLESLLRGMQPTEPEEPVYRTTVSGPRLCRWYEDEENTPQRRCRFPGVNFLLVVAGAVALVIALKR